MLLNYVICLLSEMPLHFAGLRVCVSHWPDVDRMSFHYLPICPKLIRHPQVNISTAILNDD